MGRAVSIAASLLVCAACGRGGYEPSAQRETSTLDEGSDNNVDPARVGPDGFSSSDNSCQQTRDGPFEQVANLDGSRSYGVWWQPPFLLVARPGGATDAALESYRLEGDKLVLAGRDTPGGFVEAIYFDGEVFYVGIPGRGLLVYRIDSAGQLSVLAENSVELKEARQAWGDGSTVFVPTGPDGLWAIQFDGDEISLVGESLPTTGFALGAMVHDDGEIYFSDNNATRIVTFDGNGFIEKARLEQSGATRAWSVQGVVFAAGTSAVRALRRDGTDVQVLATFSTRAEAAVRGVWSDGANVYVAASTDGVYALEFDAAARTLSEKGFFATPAGGNALGITGNSELIFVGFDSAGLYAFRGFECAGP